MSDRGLGHRHRHQYQQHHQHQRQRQHQHHHHYHRHRQHRRLPLLAAAFLFVVLHVMQLQITPAAVALDATTDATTQVLHGGAANLLANRTMKDAKALKPKGSVAAAIATKEKVDSPAKSYISAPTVHVPKQAKRTSASTTGAKKLTTEARNNTKQLTAASKGQKAVVADHIPNPSSHVPYRVGRPHYSGGEYAENTLTTDRGAYEAEKWRHEYWERGYTQHFGHNTTRVQHIEAECQDDFMKIRIGFNDSFSGLLYSAGYAYDPDCMYINGTGRDYYEFYIQLNRCGTLGKNALQDESRKNPTNFMWNTITVQYNPLIEEEFDEHFKVTCEYGYDFWKTVTFPFLDVEVATGNPVVFTLSPPECYMEIQNGYGIGGARVTGPVRVGDPLTLIIYMRSKYDGFDIVVNDCYAHNGANKRIQLIDEFGCPVDDKLISRFRGSWTDSGVFETQVYAYMKTFRFTGSPALYIECDVRMCHGRCPSQPCHWRNLKAVTKRDISNSTASTIGLLPAPVALTGAPPSLADTMGVTEQPEISLSENVNLFQSLRVLQEGETDAESFATARSLEPPPHYTCLKTSLLSALMVGCAALMCLLTAGLMVTCSRLRHRTKDTSLYDSNYVTHKGQFD